MLLTGSGPVPVPGPVPTSTAESLIETSSAGGASLISSTITELNPVFIFLVLVFTTFFSVFFFFSPWKLLKSAPKLCSTACTVFVKKFLSLWVMLLAWFGSLLAASASGEGRWYKLGRNLTRCCHSKRTVS